MAKKITKGERLRGLDAASWNEFVEASEKIAKLPTFSTRLGKAYGVQSLASIVFNATGADLTARFPVLKLSEPKLNTTAGAHIVSEPIQFIGTTPDASTTVNDVGVMQGPVQEDLEIAAVHAGPTWVDVNVTNAAHGFAVPAIGDNTKLASATSGIKIIWRPSGTGVKRSLVILGGAEVTSTAEQNRLIRGQVKGDVTADDTTFIIDNVSELASGLDPTSGNTATEITVENVQKESIEDNTWVTAIFDGLAWELLLVERYRMLRGQAVGAVTSSNLVFNVDNIHILCSGVDPRSDPTSAAETVEIDNTHGADLADNAQVVAVFNAKRNVWEALPKTTAAAPAASGNFLCTLAGSISAGSTANRGVGSGTVYQMGTGSANTSLGSRTIYNPFIISLPATAPGSKTLIYTCVRTYEHNPDTETAADDKFTVTGIDPLNLLATLTGFAQMKSLGVPEAGTDSDDLQWLGAECEA